MISELIQEFEQNANPEKASRMKSYMKNHFEFYGIPSPLRKQKTDHDLLGLINE